MGKVLQKERKVRAAFPVGHSTSCGGDSCQMFLRALLHNPTPVTCHSVETRGAVRLVANPRGLSWLKSSGEYPPSFLIKEKVISNQARRELAAGGSRVQRQPQLLTAFKASLGYVRQQKQTVQTEKKKRHFHWVSKKIWTGAAERQRESPLCVCVSPLCICVCVHFFF